MVSTSSTVDGQTTVNTQLVAKDGSVLLSAGSGQTMERDPDTGIVSVRTEGSPQIRQYSPASGAVGDALTADLTPEQASQLGSDLGLNTGAGTTDQPSITITASGDGIQTDGGNITGYAETSAPNQAPAQADTAQAATDSIANAASLQSATQSAALLNTLVGLQHWASLSDVQRLTALSSLYNVADKLGGNSLPGDLGGAAAALSLVGNLERGNLGGTVVSAIALGDVLGQKTSEAVAKALGLNAAAAGNVIPGISLALALDSGDPVSVMAAAANFIPGYGPLISIGISLLGSSGLLGGGATPPPPYGEVHFAWSGLDANGQPHTTVRTDTNVSGGAATASQIAGQLLHSLQTMVEQANAQTLHDHPDTEASQLLALNTNLLPSVFWDKDQTSLKLPNPDGATSFFVNLAEPDAMAQVVQLLQTNGGIAPQWLVDTQSQRYAQLLNEGADGATIERELTAGKSGLSEQAWSQAAAIQGSAGEAADFKTQQFGSLVVHAQDAQVQLTEALKNIDHDAYLERSEWVAASDAQGQAQSLLVIDFNADGVIDTRDVLNLGGNRGQTDAKDAQMQGDYADLQRNNVLWLDANGDGVLDARDPAFAAVKLYMDINADARVQDGEAQGLAQAGITAIDFKAGQVRYADGHSDALTAQLLTGETSGVKLTKVYEVVDGQQVDLHAGEVLESEGYQGQDADGAIRQQTFAHEAVRTGDWEGTAEQEAHRHGGGNGDEAPAQTTASGAESQGEFKTQAQTTSQRTVVANQIRQTQTPERLAFVPLGIGLNGIGSLPEAGLVTADMVQSMQAGLLGGGGLNLGLLGVLAVGATQSAAQAADAQVLAAANTSAGLLPGDLSTLGPLTANGQGEALATSGNSDGAVVGATPVQGTALSLSAVPGPAALAALGGEAPIVAAPATGSEKSATTGASAPVTSAPPLLWQAALTSAPLANAQPGNPSGTRGTDQAPADAASPVDAAAVGAAAQGASNCTVLDYPVVRGETLSGNEDVIFRIPGTLLVSNDSTPNAPANPAAPDLTVTAVGNAVHGQVSLINGEVVFVPEANFFGTASFMYAATDQYGLSRTATASLEVSAVNDAPAVTGGEEIDGEEEQALIIQAAGLLQNDYDVDNPHEDLALSRVQSGTGGTVSLDANGDVVFTPDHDFFGDAAFTYWVRDSAGAESSPVTATVVVAPVNDAPGAQGEEVAGASEDAVFTISKSTLLANDHDVDDPNSALSVNWVGNTTGGTVSLDASGNVVFTPTVNFNGYASFSYTVRDAAGLVSPVVLATIPVAAVNDAPLGVDDQFSTYRNSTMSIGFGQLTGNDSDVENDVLTVSSVRDHANGHASIVDGKVQFVPTTGFAGTASFDYLADDGQGGQTWTTAYVNVIVPPQYPTVNVTLGSSWVEVYHGDAANLRQTFNYSFDDENPATVSMTIQPNFGAGFTYAGFGDVRWVTATDFNIFKYDRYGNANISLNLNLTDESGLTNTAHVYVRYSSLPNGVSQFQVWHDHTGYATPVVLDLDGQGLQAVATKDSNVTFDVDEDGVADRMAWVGAGNGVLALDIDGDDKISDAKEFVFKQYVEGAQTDLEGLAAFDRNHDAKLDTNDELFAKFGVWQDADSNGIQDAGEYQTLVQLGIASIDLRSNAQVQGVNSEVVSFGSAQFTRADGSTGVAYDAMLAYQSGADKAAALIGSASLEDTTSITIPGALPATPGDADVLNANAMQMALLFNQMCNTAPANDPGLLGFVPIETDACAKNWDEVAQLQLQVA